MSLPTDEKFRDLLKKIEQFRPGDDLTRLAEAYRFAAQYHADQLRASGEPYLSHPLEVAHILADMRMDVATITTAVLHDIVEDTSVTIEEIEAKFGPEIAHLVEGVTKMSRLVYSDKEQRQAENVRKMLLAMVDDLRVILVKLADRLHNMRTLQFLPPEKQKAVAQETLEIYAPLAHRMGMAKIRGELEDLSFAYIDPLAHQEMSRELDAKRKSYEEFLKDVSTAIEAKLKAAGIEGSVSGRIKRRYSVYSKMKRHKYDLRQVYDLLAVRIVTESVNDCYAALGVIHQIWPPIPGRIKDFIAMPRPNLYQSLHTTVVGSNGQPFEIQIRTREMHRTAEEGIAAHWKYKEGASTSAADEKSMAWLRQLVEWQQELSDPTEFLSTLKIDLYPEEVYTFTPKGRVVVLPRDASAVDFAYAIHTEVGNTCTGARVNSKLMPLRYKLRSGDIVEIVTQKGAHPSRDWLGFVNTSRARNKIKHWIAVNEKANAVDLGRRILEKQGRRDRVAWKKVSAEELLRVSHELGYPKTDDLYSAVGFGKMPARQVVEKLFPDLAKEESQEAKPESKTISQRIQNALGMATDGALQVKGYGNMLVYRSKCCEPIPGEEIVGYITRGKGVAVHSKKCPNVQNLLYHAERRIEVEWASSGEDSYSVQLQIRTVDRPGLLKELTAAISEKTNIRNIETKMEPEGDATISLSLDIEDTKHLDRLIMAMRKINGIRDVERIHRTQASPASS